MRLKRCSTCNRLHPLSVGCAVCRARIRVADRLCAAVGQAAYDRLEYLMSIHARPGTPEGAELDALATLISNAEAHP
jgi:hypothetical protein